MSESPKISAEALGLYLQQHAPALAERIVSAINAAEDGHWIDGSEELIREAGHEFTRQAFEVALQQKINATEAAAPPRIDSGGKKNETKASKKRRF